MCWLRVYARLRVKLKVEGTGVRSVLSWRLDDRTRQFRMCWLRVYAWLCVKIKVKGTGVRFMERGNFLCAGYASPRGYASKLRLRVPVLVLFCGVGWIMERCFMSIRTENKTNCLAKTSVNT